MDRISLVILNYNQANRIDRAIRSCQNQYRTTFEIEIIVVDDHSEDDSLSILREFESDIKLIVNPKNLGVGAASNVALEAHTGNYFMRVDADDFLSPISCATLLLAIKSHPSASYAYGDHFRVNEKGFKQELVSLGEFRELLRHGAGVLYDSNEVQKVEGYDSELRHCEDMDLLLKLNQSGKNGIHVPLPLYRYYHHDSNLSHSVLQQNMEAILIEKYGL
jgi:GT2 family glycosyltransferase